MSENTPGEFGTMDDGVGDLPDDEIRVHSQDPAEGADPDDPADAAPDQPRVHSEDGAEG